MTAIALVIASKKIVMILGVVKVHFLLLGVGAGAPVVCSGVLISGFLEVSVEETGGVALGVGEVPAEAGCLDLLFRFFSCLAILQCSPFVLHLNIDGGNA